MSSERASRPLPTLDNSPASGKVEVAKRADGKEAQPARESAWLEQWLECEEEVYDLPCTD